MEKNKFYQISVFDFILTAIILFYSFGLLLSFGNDPARAGQPSKALIYKDNQLIKELDLTQNKIINIDKIELETKDGRIKIIKADCPRKKCMHSGEISRPGQTLVCLPNKLLISITGINNDENCNAVSY